MKMNGSVFNKKKKSFLRCWNCLSRQSYIGILILSLLLKSLQENWNLDLLFEVSPSEVELYLCKSTI